MRRLLSAALVVVGATVAACIHGPVVMLPTPQPAVGSAANAALTQRKYGDSILHGGLRKVYTDGVTITGTGTQADPLATHGTGTVTSITAGTGLAGGTITGSGTISLSMPTTGCSPGFHMSGLSSTGSGSCTADTTYSHPTHTCAAGTHASAVDASGDWTCSADSGVTGSGTTGDLAVWSSTGAIGPYGGAVCGFGYAIQSLSASGGATCAAYGTSNLTNSAGANVLPKSNGTNLVASQLSDDGTTVSVGTGASSILDVDGQLSKFGSGNDGGIYLEGATVSSLNFDYGTASITTGYLNRLSYAGGTGTFRNLAIQDGKAADILTLTGSTHAAEFHGALTVDGSTTLGDASTDTTETKGPLTVDGAPKCAGSAPTVSSGSVAGTNCSGIITSGNGTSETITWTAGFWSHTPPCTFTMASGSSTAAVLITAQSTTSTAISFPNSLGSPQTINYNCGFGY